MGSNLFRGFGTALDNKLNGISGPAMPRYEPARPGSPLKESLFSDEDPRPYWEDTIEGMVFNAPPDAPKSVWCYMIFPDNDGARLVDAYLKDGLDNEPGAKRDGKVDIDIYYERDDAYNSLGTVCFVKMNKALTMRVKESSAAPGWLAREIIGDANDSRRDKPWYVKMNEKKLTAAIQFELVKADPANTAFSWIVKKASDLLHDLAEGIRGAKYLEKQWNPKAKGFTPVVDTQFLNDFRNVWRRVNNGIQKTRQVIERLKSIMPDSLYKSLKSIIDGAQAATDLVDEVFAVLDVSCQEILMIYAFCCGFTNGLLDFIAGIVDIAALLLTLNEKEGRQKIEEALENTLQQFREQPKLIVELFKKAVQEFLAHYGSDKSQFEKAYYAGEDIVTVVDLVVTLVSIIGAFRKLPAKFRKLEEWVGKVAGVVKADIKTILKRIATEESKTDELFRALKKAISATSGEEILSVKAIKLLRRELLDKFGVDLKVVGKQYGLKDKLRDWNQRGVAASFNVKESTIFIRPEVTPYTVEHELHHMKLWYKMTREFPEMADQFSKLNKLQHEEYVLAEFMKNTEQWKMADLKIDLNNINRIRTQEYSLPNVDLNYFKKWQFPNS